MGLVSLLLGVALLAVANCQITLFDDDSPKLSTKCGGIFNVNNQVQRIIVEEILNKSAAHESCEFAFTAPPDSNIMIIVADTGSSIPGCSVRIHPELNQESKPLVAFCGLHQTRVVSTNSSKALVVYSPQEGMTDDPYTVKLNITVFLANKVRGKCKSSLFVSTVPMQYTLMFTNTDEIEGGKCNIEIKDQLNLTLPIRLDCISEATCVFISKSGRYKETFVGSPVSANSTFDSGSGSVILYPEKFQSLAITIPADFLPDVEIAVPTMAIESGEIITDETGSSSSSSSSGQSESTTDGDQGESASSESETTAASGESSSETAGTEESTKEPDNTEESTTEQQSSSDETNTVEESSTATSEGQESSSDGGASEETSQSTENEEGQSSSESEGQDSSTSTSSSEEESTTPEEDSRKEETNVKELVQIIYKEFYKDMKITVLDFFSSLSEHVFNWFTEVRKVVSESSSSSDVRYYRTLHAV